MGGTTNPGSFRSGYLQPGTAVGNLPINVGLNADNLVVNVGSNGYLRLVSDNATSTNRTFSLAGGAYMGQVLYITVVGSSTNQVELLSTGNVSLTGGTWTATVGDSIMLIWDGLASTQVWREITRATASQILIAGTYTPTFTAGTNVAVATTGLAHYYRIGTQVSVYGTGSISSTAATNTASTFGISLPIASNLAAVGDLTGSGNILSATGTPSASCTITGDAANDRAAVAYNAAQTAAGTLGYSFAYTVI